jgi:hypothetical protein
MYRGRYRGKGAGSARAVATTTYIVDKLATAPWSAHSVRQLRQTYLGACLRVRRSSDNVEQDIGFTTAGVLDTAALATFVGVNDGFVTTWYDQTGNSRNMVQTNTALQGRVTVAGALQKQDNNPALVFAAGQYMTQALGTVAQPYSRSSVFQIDNRTAGAVLLDSSSTSIGGQLYEDAVNSLAMNAGSIVGINSNAGVGANGQYTIAELYNGAASTVSLNGVVSTINPGTNAINGLSMNADWAGVSTGANRFVELLFWNAALDVASRQTLTLNQRSFFTTP